VAGGIGVNSATGEAEWQTLPFVAVHYAEETGLVGAAQNAVLAGHVVTLSQGNVFRELYRVLPGDRMFVRTQGGGAFAYEVSDVRLVSPGDVDVMRPTEDAELTLITCAGTYDSRTQRFSQRLVIVGRLIGAPTV
jgi:sortase A